MELPANKSAMHTAIEQHAEHFFNQGYNCCQCQLLAANELWGLNLSQDTIAAGHFFRHGMGSGATCGALIGAQMVLGILDDRYQTKLSNKYARQLVELFNKTFNTLDCRDLRKQQGLTERIGQRGCRKITLMTSGILFDFWEKINGK